MAAVAAVAVATLVDAPGPTDLGDGPDPTTASPPPVEDGDVREVTADEPEDAPPSLAFTATGLAGGGFQNVVAFSPDGDVALAGADNASLHRSTDAGLTWTPVGAGLPEWAGKVAGIAWHPTEPGVVVAAGGFAGQTGGVLRSEDGGRTWTVASEAVRFSGANTPNVPGLPRTHPRATGQVLLWVDDVLFAATFDAGVHRSTDGGRTWELIGIEDRYLRGLAEDVDGSLLVATNDDGLWRIADPTGVATAEPLGDGPAIAEEVVVAGEDVLVAAGSDGAWARRDGVWDRVYETDAVVTTVGVDGNGQWWAGTHEDRDDDGGILRSTDRGETWTAVDDGTDPVIAGTRLPWWVAQAQSSFLPGNGGWTAAQFTPHPTLADTILLSGRAGLWRTEDGGETWQAAVAGLGVTAHDQTAVAADGRIATANTDHRLLVSDDELRTVMSVEPGETKGTAVADDPTSAPGTLLVATAERDANTDGELYRVQPGSSRFESLQLGREVGRQRVLAVTAGTDGNGRAVVIAAVEEGGVWRLVDGTWSRVGSGVFAGRQASPDGALVWPEGDTVVHALDRASGVWRSDDAGLSWERVLEVTVGADRTDPAGFLDAGGDGSVWVATADRLLRLDAPGGPPTPVDVDRPGPLVMLDDGGVLVVTRDDVGVLPRLVHVCGSTVTEIATGERFRGGAIDATDLDVDGSGHLVVTTATNGLLRSATPVTDLLPCDVAPTP